MKKTLLMAVAVVALSAPAAFADSTTDAAPAATTSADAPHKDGSHKDKMLEKIDTNKDGVISKAEFMTFHEERFAELDTNKDGNVTKDESDAAKAKWKEKMKEMKAKKAEKEGSSTEAPK